ncbi:M1 family aminopeptidase [Chitinophaga defluvii]|uniref:M1 family aminopeptidase n=1 Tax=Chitinophaga defluvii TaxID=3163343 RepID=A0ABV2T2Y1_9BACT
MKILQPVCLIIVFFLLPIEGIAQDLFLALSGKIVNAQTGIPIPYANIQLKSKGTGTISNTAGEFILKIPTQYLPDSVVISCMGYQRSTLPIPAAGFTDQDILLTPAVLELKEVAVKVRSGWDILKAAMASIPDNYDTAAVRLTAFYREHLWLEDQELNFNESVLEIIKTFYTDEARQDQIRILKGRKKEIKHHWDPQFFGFISNISNTAKSTLGEEPLKNIKAPRSVFNPENYRYYDCVYQETIREGDRHLLVLEIFPKQKSKKGLLNAQLYIDEASLAIVKFKWDLSPAGVKYVNRHGKGGFGYTIMSKVVKATFDFTQVKVAIGYKYYQGKWYLHTIQRSFEAALNSPKRGIDHRSWRADMDLVVTDISKDSVQRFTAGNILNSNAAMSSVIGNEADDSFWENYNILKPVIPDSLRQQRPDTTVTVTPVPVTRVSNRQNGFTHADTLRGQLSPLRSCYDVTYYHLDVSVNMDARTIQGNNLMRFKVVSPFAVMQVDLYANMKIDSILYRGQPLAYTREAAAVFVRFPQLQPVGSEQEIRIYYAGVPQVPDFKIPMNGGILWDKDAAGNPWAQVVCQGSGASLWWPNKDHLSDEPDSMRIWITVPEGFTEISNGRLIRKTPVGHGKTRYEWLVSYPINNYNVTFNIGKHTHYRDYYITDDTLTIDYYMMPYNLERARNMFQQVKPMLQCFEKSFGKYPFPRDGFTLVESLYPMEHQSGVCIGRITAENAVGPNRLLWHESAHEWWGNAISCKDLADMWIHEAFATYAEALMIACTEGESDAQDYITEQRAGISNKEPVIGVYDVNHIFYDTGDMYNKGIVILHTFRNILNNDSSWFRLLHDIQQFFRYKTLSSDELVDFICQRTHTDYRYFFEQYLKYTTIPKLELARKEIGNDLVIKYRWQADVKDFRMPVKITTSANKYTFIYPTTTWQTKTLKKMNLDDFEVDEEGMYFELLAVGF